MRGAYLQNKEVIRMSPAGADDPPMLKLACLYRVREIKWGSRENHSSPSKGRTCESELSWRAPIRERERERERDQREEVPSKWSSLFYIKGSHLLSNCILAIHVSSMWAHV
jgi:hypothetical protein